MDNISQIRRAGTTYWQRHAKQRPAVQRKTQRERQPLFMYQGNLSPLLHKRRPWWTREATLLDALVLCVCVVAIVAMAFGWPR